jgi:hypothetical protein
LDSPEIEIVIVDNGEYRNEKRIPLDIFGGKPVENCKILVNEENKGFGVACNQGVEAATGEIILFLNPDCFISVEDVKKMAEVFARSENIGCLAPEVDGEDQKNLRWSYAKHPCGWDRVLLGKRFFGENKQADSQKKMFDGQIEDVFWISGTCFMMRKDLFTDLGGFDPRFFMYFEDKDLCLRAHERGYRVARLVGVKAVHLESKSGISWRRRKTVYYASQSKFFRKYYGILAMLLLWLLRTPFYVKNVFLGKR